MHHPISPSALDLLTAEASATASRLCRRLGLPATDHDDFRQELLADLIRRLPAFDPDRGTLGAFANVVLRNHAVRITARVLRERRARGGALLSLDAPRADGTTLADTLSEADGLSTWQCRSEAIPRAERRIDVDRALGELDDSDQTLCDALSHWSVDELAAGGFSSRATLYRRLAALRPVLAAYGLRAA